MEATILRPYEPADAEWGGQAGLATLDHGGRRYEISYSAMSGLSVRRGGDFADAAPRPDWCFIGAEDDGRPRIGYRDAAGRWIAVEPVDGDREVREWARRNYRSLFGLRAPAGRRPADPTPYHKPEGVPG